MVDRGVDMKMDNIQNHHLAWFKLKQPYAVGSEAYRAAYAKLSNATPVDLERLRAEFEFAEEQSGLGVVHYYDEDECEWLCRFHVNAPDNLKNTHGRKIEHQVNMRGIERHRKSFRVSKRMDGKLRRWVYKSLSDAMAKRDIIFATPVT